MTYFIAGNTAVENARALAQSALPDAPQQPDVDQAQPAALRERLGAVLRAVGRLADRVDPRPSYSSSIIWKDAS